MRLPGHIAQTGPRLIAVGRAKPLSEVIGPLKLDRITVADGSDWLDMIDCEANLPDWVAPGLRELESPSGAAYGKDRRLRTVGGESPIQRAY